ncbi:hypothetical protein RND71_020549 [Anisodus tanguticus]|uniref:Uncharacterized protein n=1 Tax=Anisodus tanguticus TaxID=243964 RepID=A0AAE1VAG7_9SOLA|nr:hypothetical protein RND71_020549 [Anisodus tanguticus]
MQKATFLKIFLFSFLLILLGQASNGAFVCFKDTDCVGIVQCKEGVPICSLTTHKCTCLKSSTTNNGPKNVHKTDQD